jgi:hypothetical protein
MGFKFSLSLEGQAMTAPTTTAAFTAFPTDGTQPTKLGGLMIHNPGPEDVRVVSTVSGGKVASLLDSHIVMAGERMVFTKKDTDTGLSLLSEGAAQPITVYFGTAGLSD